MDDGGPRNVGAYNSGSGSITVGGSAIGSQRIYHPAEPPTRRAAAGAGRDPDGDRRADIGILTVLEAEMVAVVEVLERMRDHRSYQMFGGAQVHEASVRTDGGSLRTVAMQTLGRGPQSAAVAYRDLRGLYRPPIVLLVGVAGGIRSTLDIGDVVISEEVIYYDARRETPTGAQRRGQAHQIAPVLLRRLNEFFVRQRGIVQLDPETHFRVHRGPIGSGDAVITDADSDIRAYLERFNERTLAVETEAGGVAQAFYEEVDVDQTLRGWLTIRGISDLADRHKGHEHHDLAARHAAAVMERLLPYLWLTEAGQ
ncbi:5'-methylthioadenosine/S-adenosylhomocysteine nucleosidase [Micromonospora sp. NBC_01699]|uniref:5'-methylthioadenosine/S-adenosylhomocysteine nucleosidase family protein n=1 Tax=Micromonospora sp. NBC_01699 TaxID=2975984 RepID=UPI002E3778BF|nr:5'-methylthioadenosine/S-adenosylhomocysteine nucleosidase [Micromonospora sp. NBC_01699]